MKLQQSEYPEMLHLNVFVAALLICITVGTMAQITPTDRPTTWFWYQIPNPRTLYPACGRDKPSWVCDPNILIPHRGANEIDRQINKTMRDTTCPCKDSVCHQNSDGYMISVLLLPSFYTPYTGNDRYRMLREARSFIYSVYSEHWHFARCNEFVVIMYAQNQNLLYTMTGREARKKIADADVERISTELKHYFINGRSQNITAGVLKLIEKYRALMVDRPQGDAPQALPLVEKTDSDFPNKAMVPQKAVVSKDDDSTSDNHAAALPKSSTFALFSAIIAVGVRRTLL